MHISDWSSDVCSSDLAGHDMSSMPGMTMPDTAGGAMNHDMPGMNMPAGGGGQPMEHDMSSMPGMSMDGQMAGHRSEEHTSELQSLMRISYAVFCLKKKKNNKLTR